ncbi:hypothetical protein THII_3005 [Thioploca ingrica]|uniref:Uncharacterized protein n=1 Tax=Thioploca ingrica TaxID=40754 RepID=A0A090AMT1_9GAMM|nr:hypothetical protein THII_3005 [Thioploca ingrica]
MLKTLLGVILIFPFFYLNFVDAREVDIGISKIMPINVDKVDFYVQNIIRLLVESDFCVSRNEQTFSKVIEEFRADSFFDVDLHEAIQLIDELKDKFLLCDFSSSVLEPPLSAIVPQSLNGKRDLGLVLFDEYGNALTICVRICIWWVWRDGWGYECKEWTLSCRVEL